MARRAALLFACALAGCAGSAGSIPLETPMHAPAPVRHVTVSIDRPADQVYAFCREPGNLPLWAAGLAGGAVRVEGEDVLAPSPMGMVRVRFARENDLGVLDHDVTLPTGETVRNPMRVLANGRGSEVVFTLLRRSGVTAQDFERDVAAVERDLHALKALLESR